MNARSERAPMSVALTTGILVLVCAGAALPAPRPASAAGSRESFAQAGGAATAIALGDGVGFAGIGASLVPLDLSDPLRPIELGTAIALPDVAEDLAVDDGYLFVATRATGGNGDARLLTFDVRAPRSPRPIGAGLPLPASEIGAVAVAYGYLILATEHGVLLVDVKDPTKPRVITQVPTGASTTRRPWAADVAVGRDGLVWIARPWGLYSMDLDDPTPAGVSARNRRPVRAVATRELEDGAARGTEAYALLEDGTVEIWAARSAAPSAVLPGLAAEPRAIAVAGDRVIVVDQAGRRVRAFDAGTPGDLWLVDEAWVEAGASDEAAIATAGEVAAVALERGGVLALRAHDLAHVGRPAVPIAPPILHTHLAGERAYASAESAGFYVLDLTEPATPRVVGALQAVAAPDGMLVAFHPSRPDPSALGPDRREVAFRSALTAGGVAFACTARDGLIAIDVALPERPEILGQLAAAPACNPGSNMAYRAGYLYLATEDRRLAVAEVADPRAMRLLSAGESAGLSGITTLALEDGYLYATGYTALTSGALYVLDTADPARPRRVAALDFSQAYAKLAVAYRRAFLSGSFGSVAIADFAPPDQLTQRPTYTGIVAGRLGLYDTLVYAAGAGHLDTMLTTSGGTLFPLGRIALPWAGEDWVGESDVNVVGGRIAILRGRAGLFSGTGPDGVTGPDRGGEPDPDTGPDRGNGDPPDESPSPPPALAAAPCPAPRRVILVADTSADMADPFDVVGADGMTIVGTAIQAFLGAADLRETEVGLGRFDQQGEFLMSGQQPAALLEAWGGQVAADLRSRVAADVRSQPGSLDPTTGGRVDLGLELARQALGAGREAAPAEAAAGSDVIILLAAGTPDGLTRFRAQARAQALAGEGVAIRTVAIGPSADAAFMAGLAGGPAGRQVATTAADLVDAMAELGRDLTRCR